MEGYLKDYRLVVDEKGFVLMEGDMIKLQNKSTGVIMKADFNKVAAYLNLSTVDETDDDALPTYDNEETLDPEKEGDQESEKAGTRNSAKWTEGQTKFLLNWYGENFINVGPLKKFRLKKNMWEQLAEEIYNHFGVKFTPLQVETRYKCVLKRRKLAIDNNDTSGRRYQEIEFEEEINEIVAKDDSLLPDFLSSPGIYTKKVGSAHKTYLQVAPPLGPITPPTTTNPQLKNKTVKKQKPSRPIAPPTTNLPSTSRNFKFKSYPPSTSTTTSSSSSPIEPSSSRKFPPFRINPPATSKTSTDSSLTKLNNSPSISSPDSPDNFEFDSEISPTPKKRARKTVQEKCIEQFIAFKKEQSKQKEQNKKERHKEKEANKNKRHEEKLQRLDRWLEKKQN